MVANIQNLLRHLGSSLMRLNDDSDGNMTKQDCGSNEQSSKLENLRDLKVQSVTDAPRLDSPFDERVTNKNRALKRRLDD